MKIFSCLILLIYLSVIVSLNQNEISKEIKYKFKNLNNPQNLDEPELKQSNTKESLGQFNVIELESDFIVTKISWTKKENYKFNYLLGIFEGANDPSFMDAIPIGIIKEEGSLDESNYVNIDIPFSFKYIRYVPPNRNNTDINPIQIYGYKKSGDIAEAKAFQATNLPLISIHTENDQVPNQNGDINCRIVLINEGKIEINDTAGIKIRGRTTSLIPPKKPYRIKFTNKQKIFNFKGKDKKWTLLANAFDRSLIRNSIAYKISELMKFKFTARCEPVDVVLNGNFQGNYYLCDKIDVDKNRINITKMEMTDITVPNVTGGYVLEIDSLSSWQKNNFKTARGIPGQIIYPEDDEITPEQSNYIKNKLNQFEDEIYKGILDNIDLESYSKYFLVEEFCGDPDHVWSSFYFTKERDDDKFYFGPVWDFDLAFDNDERLYPTSLKSDFCFKLCDSAGTARDFIQALIANKNVIEYIKNTWDELINSVLTEKALFDFIEEIKRKIQESSELNFIKWDNFVQEKSAPWNIDFGRKGEDFETSVEVVKGYVKDRFISLTNLINKAYSLFSK